MTLNDRIGEALSLAAFFTLAGFMITALVLPYLVMAVIILACLKFLGLF